MPLRQESREFGQITAAVAKALLGECTDTLDRDSPHVPGEVQRTEQLPKQFRQLPFRQWRNLRRALGLRLGYPLASLGPHYVRRLLHRRTCP